MTAKRAAKKALRRGKAPFLEAEGSRRAGTSAAVFPHAPAAADSVAAAQCRLASPADDAATARCWLERGVKALLPEAPSSLIDQLWHYGELLRRWNRVYNLTAIADWPRLVTHHLLDSLAIWPFVVPAKRLLDVGTGAGLPAVPLALAAQALEVPLLVTAVDAVAKKAAFVQQAKAELALTNLTVAQVRVEAWQPGQRFDAIVSRAFASIPEFVALTRHLIAPQGRWLAMKGQGAFAECAGLTGARVVVSEPLAVPFLPAARTLVILEPKAWDTSSV